MNRKRILKELRIELARRHFWEFCKLMAPDFYKEDRLFLKDICYALEDFYLGNEGALILNAPPRHGKSRTVSLFVQWLLGKDLTLKIITASYNEILSSLFSKTIRNSIMMEKADEDVIVYPDIFPLTKVKKGDAAMHMWSILGGYNSFLSTSPSGTATGFGASLLIIDDLIKNAIEANDEGFLENSYRWFTDTLLSRLEEGGKILVVMTRWAKNDFAGRFLREYRDILGRAPKSLVLPAMNEKGEMLCDEILSKKGLEMKRRSMDEGIFLANYLQTPMYGKDFLYERFRTYEELPSKFEFVFAYGDTADAGGDYLCMPIVGVYEGLGYVLEVVYSDRPMEHTEPLCADMLVLHNVNHAVFESNGGGRAFARNVERLLWDRHNSRNTAVSWFHQTNNKQARIITGATSVMNLLLFPHDWKERFPLYSRDLSRHKRRGLNKHDDAADATTGCAEYIQKKIGRIKGAVWVRGV